MPINPTEVSPKNCKKCIHLRKFTVAYGCEIYTDPTARDCEINKNEPVKDVSFAVSTATGLTDMVIRSGK